MISRILRSIRILYWLLVPGAFPFVYVNQDGSARALTLHEREHLLTPFHGADGGRPYIKSSYEERDGWGSMSGFLWRNALPAGVRVGLADLSGDFEATRAKMLSKQRAREEAARTSG